MGKFEASATLFGGGVATMFSADTDHLIPTEVTVLNEVQDIIVELDEDDRWYLGK